MTKSVTIFENMNSSDEKSSHCIYAALNVFVRVVRSRSAISSRRTINENR